MDKKTAQMWVKIMVILGYISAVLMALAGILTFTGGKLIGVFMPTSLVGSFATALFVVVGISFLVVAVLQLIVTINLSKYKNWARMVLIVLAVIGFIGSLASFPGGIVSLVIDGGIFYLLAINKTVKSLFK
jgi:hypothetical protein